MSTIETDRQLPGDAEVCAGCGTVLAGGRFCSDCGRPVAAPRPVTADAPTFVAPQQTWPAPPPPPAAPTGSDARPRRAVLIAGIAVGVVLIAVGVVTAILVTSKDDGSAKGAFQNHVAAVFRPVLAANNDLSRELATINGAKPTGARAAVSRAQQATTQATGALGALNQPSGSAQLMGDARQVLDRESAYLAAVSGVLSNQSSPTRGQLETLSSNLTSAFSAAGPTVAGNTSTVSGADVLTAWAQRTARVLKKRAQEKAARRRAQAGQSGVVAPATNPYANGRDCGGGVFAGPDTSCDFAFNVRSAYLEAPGLTATVEAFSPATGQTYTMDCAPSGSGVTCSGGNSASVAF